MLIYLQGLIGCLLFTYIFIVRGKHMIARAKEENSKTLSSYKNFIGQTMIIFGLGTAMMGVLLFVGLLARLSLSN